MLELKEIEWRNFMSYGDYDSHLELNSLGQCLITGEVVGEDKSVFDDSGLGSIKKSNGAGKSTIPNVILWTLFGRTMHSANPGDKVVNWFTGKDCRCKLTFKNGDYIIRTRRTNGHNELIYVKDGDETSLTSDTLSTSKNQQTELNRAFGLDWDLLCGSMFFNQYSKPWMEMADQTRKKAIERALHVDRFEYRSKIAKGKCDIIDDEIKKLRYKIKSFNEERDRLSDEHKRVSEALTRFDSGRQERQKKALQDAIIEKQRRDEIKRPDLDKLKAKWGVVDKIKNMIKDMQNQANIHSRKIGNLEGTASSIRQRIKLWHNKSGKICGSCEQDVTKSYTATKIEPIQKELDEILLKIDNETKELENILMKIGVSNENLQKSLPKLTIADASNIHREWENHDRELARLKNLANSIVNEENPHMATIDRLNELIEKCNNNITIAEKEIERKDYLNRHYNYIHKAWNDRTKIKSFIFQDHIPYINNRLKHYLNIFGLDIQIELTNALGISSNMWGYDFESGGERKRTDVAFMLAMFDFHEQMYGRQSNVLVLDEVDGRLDDDGIDSLIGIIKNDLGDKVETVMVISHRNMMHDTFAKEMKITRMGSDEFRGFSQLEIL